MDSSSSRLDQSHLSFAIDVISVVLITLSTTAAGCVAWVILRNRVSLGSSHSSDHKCFPMRERMLLGLFLTHLWAGAISIVPPLISLISPKTSLSGCPCHAIIVLSNAGMITSHLWTMVLALVTYIALVQPASIFLAWAENAWLGIWVGIYALAMLVSFGMWKVGGARYADGRCTFEGSVLKYGELMSLIPRFVVLAIILTIYVRLNIFLRYRRRDVRNSQHMIESGQIPGFNADSDHGKDEPSSSLDEAQLSLSFEATVDEPLGENMADFINRKARMLILLFPLSYTILVLVSLVKLSYDAVHPHQNLVLNGVGRWALFSQSGLDAMTYGWAAARMKRAVRRLEDQRAAGK